MSPTILAIALALATQATEVAQPPRTREFQFTYTTMVSGLQPSQKVRVWLPVPPTNGEQEASLITRGLPESLQIAPEPKYGNSILYVEPAAAANGTATIGVSYRILRRELRADLEGKTVDHRLLQVYLKPDAKVPITGKPLSLLEGKGLPSDQLATGRVLYDLVNRHMRYSKEGTGWGQGDAVWACDSRYGNCSDFHSLFISLARSRNIPAQFEMGFPLPEKRGEGEIAGYHCWAKFMPEGKGWVPVDISEANKNPALVDYYFGNLSENRVAFSIGRDIALVPRQTGEPLNFFIYPYVELNGRPISGEKVKWKTSFKDITH